MRHHHKLAACARKLTFEGQVGELIETACSPLRPAAGGVGAGVGDGGRGGKGWQDPWIGATQLLGSFFPGSLFGTAASSRQRLLTPRVQVLCLSVSVSVSVYVSCVSMCLCARVSACLCLCLSDASPASSKTYSCLPPDQNLGK